MKNLCYALAILIAGCVLVYAQSGESGVTGTWRAESTLPGSTWTAVLRVDGPRVIGAVSSCASVEGAFEIFEGKIDGNTLAFKCKSGDGQRTITLAGRISGDEIAFTWKVQVQSGGNPPNASHGVFAPSAPPRFTAKRVPDAADAAEAKLAEVADHIRRSPVVTFDRILHADQQPEDWLTYSGTMLGQRYSRLTQITPANVKDLELAWLWQAQSSEKFEATPLVVDGVLYTVEAPNNVVALDADTGHVLWTYPYSPAPNTKVCCGRVNRGLAIIGGTLFMGTLDAHLLAIDAYTGRLIWNTTVANSADPACKGGNCYAITHAPLVVKDKVIVGTAGGDTNHGSPTDQGIRGFIAAFNVTTGKEVWRFYTIPGPGEPGNDTWSGNSWKTGGASVWNTGTYDSELNLTYWGTGNPEPDYDDDHVSTRLGDNLYSDSVVALDADTGKLKWHYQFTPHDIMDWDSAQVPVLTELEWQGRPRKVMLWANRNGLMYVLDRTTGQFLMGKPFVELNWMNGFDEKGRPVLTGTPLVPGPDATIWYPPSYSPRTGLFYFPAWERAGQPRPIPRPSPGYGAVRAFDPKTGEKKWEFKRNDAVFTAGVLTTASDLLFTGTWGDDRSGPAAARLANGYFYALDARTGQLLWQMKLAGTVQSGPMSYAIGGKQYVAVAAGNTLFALTLPQ